MLMINLDNIIKDIKKKSGYDNEYRIKLYLADALRDHEDIRDLITQEVLIDMENNGEFEEETKQQRIDRLERIERG
jgi:hypothetical protein